MFLAEIIKNKNIIFGHRDLNVSILVIFGLLYLPHAFKTFPSSWSLDFYQFWAVGHRINEFDRPLIYSEVFQKSVGEKLVKLAEESGSKRELNDANGRKNYIEFAGTPFLYTVFSWLPSGEYDFDYSIYHSLSLTLFLLGIFLFLYFASIPFILGPLVLMILTDLSLPFYSDSCGTNTNQLQLGLISIFLLLRLNKRKKWVNTISAFFLGLLFYFKPNIIFSVVFLFAFWFFSSSKTELIEVSCGFLIATIFVFVYSGLYLRDLACWFGWGANFMRIIQNKFYLEKSFLGWLGIFPKPETSWILGIMALCPVIAGIVFNRTKFKSLENLFIPDIHYCEFLLFGLGLLVYILTAQMVHDHYFVLTFMPTLALLSIRPLSAPKNRIEIWTKSILVGFSIILINYTVNITRYFGTLVLYGCSLWVFLKKFKPHRIKI